ncbi:Ig domain-containing protein [Solirubrobacter soli]|uniref:Ig domain-containing protein n=1 Tax=Solirubrobacter soli TaxID=363832 RepID=UPI000425E1B4|nr:Ig domain-containing protein [Solirubrobacter soli]
MPTLKPLAVVTTALALLTLPASASAAPTVCSPATCGQKAKPRTLVLAPKHKTKKARKTTLRVTVAAPKGARARVRVSGPGGFKRTIKKTTRFGTVRPGAYRVVAAPIAGKEYTTFATYRETRATLRKGAAGAIDVRFGQRVKNATRVAAASAVKSVADVGGGVLEATVESPTSAIGVGSVLAAGIGPVTPKGLLIAVESVTRSGTQTIARGKQAPLTAIGPTGELVNDRKLSLGEVKKTSAFTSAMPRAFAAGSTWQPLADTPLVCSTGSGQLSSSVSVAADLRVQLGWNASGEVSARVSGDLSAMAGLNVRLTGASACTLDADLLGHDLALDPVEIYAGPVPAVIVPTLGFHGTVSAVSGSTLETAVSPLVNATIAAEWDAGGFSKSAKVDRYSASSKPVPRSAARVRASVTPRITWAFPGAHTLAVAAENRLSFDADPAAKPWWKLASGVGISAALSVAGGPADERTVWSEDWPVQNASALPIPVFAAAAPPRATPGAAYSATLSASSSYGPLSYSITRGALPAGIALDAATGVISGTWPADRWDSAQFVLAARDRFGNEGWKTFTVDTVGRPLAITTTTLPDGTATQAYSASIAADRGVVADGWSVVAGALPPGVKLGSDGQLAGLPTKAGTFTFTVRAVAFDGAVAVRELTITIAPAALAITKTTLGDATFGQAYEQTLTATGGLEPYTWSATGVPAGLAVSSGGRVTGSPTVAGAKTFSATVTDADGRTATATIALTIQDIPAPVVSTATLPEGMVGVAYQQTLAATGGRGPYTWSATGANGLSVSAGGVVSGTPSAASTTPLNVTVTDADGRTGSRTINVAVLPAGLEITAEWLSDGHVNEAYDDVVTVIGGTAPYTFSLDSGTLPGGLSLNASTGHITGTSNASSTTTATFTVKVEDSAGQTDTQALSLKMWKNSAISLWDVSCPTAGFCMALDAMNGAYALEGGRWRPRADSVPMGMFAGQLSCATETFCMVVNQEHGIGIFDGTAWTVLPDPGFPDHMFSDVDCVTPTYCAIAAITWDPNTQDPESQVLVYDGSGWTLHGSSPGVDFWFIDCVAVDQCVLTGGRDSATFDGTTLSMLAPQADVLRDVACASMTTCFAPGDTGAYAFAGTAFGAVNVTGGGQTLWMAAGGCAPTGDRCIAGGGNATFDSGVTSLWLWNGAAWNNSLTVPAGVYAKGSCGGPSFCVAVTNTGRGYIWNGTTWSGPRTFAHAT